MSGPDQAGPDLEELDRKAERPRPDECLAATEYFDLKHPAVQDWVTQHVPSGTARERAVAIYYKVRDSWRYNPYTLVLEPHAFRLSHLTGLKQSYCIPKALLMVGYCRAAGIPGRLGLGDVRNHLSSPRLIEYLRTDIFAFHGFAELYIDGRWVRATPAFDARLCAKFAVEPLEFDGRSDSLFHEHNRTGNRFMEYVRYRGVFADVPYQAIRDGLYGIYPHLFEQTVEGDLYDEGPD